MLIGSALEEGGAGLRRLARIVRRTRALIPTLDSTGREIRLIRGYAEFRSSGFHVNSAAYERVQRYDIKVERAHETAV